MCRFREQVEEKQPKDHQRCRRGRGQNSPFRAFTVTSTSAKLLLVFVAESSTVASLSSWRFMVCCRALVVLLSSDLTASISTWSPLTELQMSAFKDYIMSLGIVAVTSSSLLAWMVWLAEAEAPCGVFALSLPVPHILGPENLKFLLQNVQ